MNLELDSILEQSLSRMQAGKAGVESSLPSDPEMANQLEPLLLVAERLWSIPKPTLPPAAKAQMESRLLAAAAANPLLRPVGQQRKPIVMSRWSWGFSALIAILLFVFLMTAMMVNASADALPGTPLYPVKRVVEDASLWVAPAREEPALHLRYARRRLAETQTLAQQGQFDPSLVEAMASDIEAAVTGAETLPPAIALPVLDGLADLLNDQQQTLVVVLDWLPETSRPPVVAALSEAVVQATRVETVRRALQLLPPVSSPEVSPSPIPSGTAEPSAAAGATPTPTRTPEPSPSPSGTLTLVPTPESTVRTNPEPSREPTATQPPEPAPTEVQPAPTEVQPAPTEVPPAPTEVQPAPTDVPPEQTRVPPGQTKTPEPPGHTKTPKPPDQDKVPEPPDLDTTPEPP